MSEALNTAIPSTASSFSVTASPAPPDAPPGQEWRIISITSVGHTLCHIGELMFAAILVALCQEFDLERDQTTLLGLAGFILFGVGAVPTGLWTDRWGSKRVLLVYFFALAAAALGVALAPTPLMLALALTALGAAISLYHPAGLTMIAHGCRVRGRAMGINGVAGSLGVAAGPALGIFFAGIGHWRLGYVLLAAASFLSGLVMLMLRLEEPVIEEPRPSVEANGDAKAAEVDNRGLWLLLLTMMLGGLNYRCLMTALPTFLAGSEADAGSLKNGALWTFLVLAAGGLGQYAGGHTADRFQPFKFYFLLIAATVPLALLMAHGGWVMAVPAAGVLAVFLFAQQPVENTIMAHITSPRRRSTLYGIKFLLTFGVGALGVQLVGIIWQQTDSMAPVFDLFAIGALLMALLAVAFRFVRLRGATPPEPAGQASSQCQPAG
jgi:MFS family permease